MNSRLSKYDLSGLSAFGADCATSAEVTELRELLIAERGLQREFIDDDGHSPELSDWPVAIHVPEGYEESYAYPLIVWLHDDGDNEGVLDHVMPAISERNYMGLSFRANCRAGGWPVDRYRWSMTMDEARFFEDVLYVTTCRLRRAWHIHSERIVIGGSGSGATLALQLLLRRPEWFCGAIMLGGRMPSLERPLANFAQLRGKRVLQIANLSDPLLDVTEFSKLRRQLYTAGVDPATEVAETNVPCEETLRCIDYWMMNTLQTTHV